MKKLILTSVLILSFTSQAYGQNCGMIPDGQVVRLDGENGSLKNNRVQDQDGLGTCYANAASVVLHSAMPDAPNLSYINLAVEYAESVNRNKSRRAYNDKKNPEDKKQMILDGGHVCETIEIAKQKGGVCKRSDVPLEEVLFKNKIGAGADPKQLQKEIFLKISDYYDSVNRTFPTAPKSTVIIQDLVNPEVQKKIEEGVQVIGKTVVEAGKKIGGFLGSLGSKFKSFFDAVLDRKREEPLPGPVIIEDRNEQAYEDLIKKVSATDEPSKQVEQPVVEEPQTPKDPNLFSREKFEALKKSTKELSPKEKYQLALYDLIQKNAADYSLKNCEVLETKNAITVTQDLSALLYSLGKSSNNRMYSNISATLSIGEYYYKGPSELWVFKLRKNFEEKIKQIYLNGFSRFPLPKSGRDAFLQALRAEMPEITEDQFNEVLNQLDPEVMSLLEDDYDRYAKKDYSKCSQKKLAYLLNDDGLKKDIELDPCLSQYGNQLSGVQNLVTGLDKTNVADFDRIADFLLNAPDTDYDESIMKLLSPTCTDEQKIKIPDQLTCEDEAIYFDNDDLRSPQSIELKVKQEKAKFLSKASDSLKRGKAVGISVCTAFFKQKSDYFYNLNRDCNLSDDTGMHAVSVIGYRCKAGKMDYLIQNSWGYWHNLDEVKYERDEKIGKAWIDDDSLTKNMGRYSLLGK